MLYPILYALSALSLGLWYFFQHHEQRARIFQNLFFVALASYGIAVFAAQIPFGQKLTVLFRDLLVLSLSGLALFFAGGYRRAFAITAVLLAAGLVWYYGAFMRGSLVASPNSSSAYEPDAELLVELAEGAEESVLQNVVYKYGLELREGFRLGSPEITELDDYWAVDIPDQQMDQVAAIIADLQRVPEVDWVEPNEQVAIAPRPAKRLPEVNRRFGINDPGLEHLWGFEAMKVDALYEIIRNAGPAPRKRALIAILDTGVDAKHEDLAGNYRSLNEADDNDPKGHGTHCAGIAGAVSNNGKGVASFSFQQPYVELASIKVLNAAGMGSQRSIINGILKAADAGADVISLSLGGLSNQKRERAYQKAVAYAKRKNSIVVAAAGNSNRNAKNYVPAGVDGVISVSAVDQQLQRAVFSNYVTDLKMGVAAPGVAIYSTIPGNRYSTFSGTSMATPYVAGLLGLLRSLEPGLTTAEAYELLNKTGKTTQSPAETGRLIQPHAAVAALLAGS